MKAVITCAMLWLGTLPLLSAGESSDAGIIRQVLSAQAAAWNRGDLDAFMESYWKSDELRFASGGTITHGWQATLERYKKHYPDKATMGSLAYTLHEVKVLSPDAAVVFGRWELTRDKDKPWGLFTLTFRKIAGAWVIVADHTSSGAEK